MSRTLTGRYLFARRFTQLGILFLLGAGNWFGWTILRGNLSAAKVLDTVQLADPYAVLQMLASGHVTSSGLLLGALLVLALYVLVFGRAFCSWVCPVNILADTSKWLNRNILLRRQDRPQHISRNWRYALLGLGLLLSLLIGLPAFEAISPIGILTRGVIFGIGMGWTVIAALFLFDLTVGDHAWCGHVCPLGAFYSSVSQLNLLKVYHDHEACTRCNKCFPACPEVQVLDRVGKSTGFIADGACSNCARCIEVCEDKALRFSLNVLNIKKNNTPKQPNI